MLRAASFLFLVPVMAGVAAGQTPTPAPTLPPVRPKLIDDHAPGPSEAPVKINTATKAVPRTDKGWVDRNAAFNARAKQAAEKGDAGVLFIGDSITQGWEGAGKEVWDEFYAKRSAMNLGIGGDRTQHVLWRLENGNIAGMAKPKSGAAPKAAVLMIGTNNSNGSDNTSEEIAAGVKAIVAELRERLPDTKVLVLGIFPRGEKPNPQRSKNEAANAEIAALADGNTVFYMQIGDKFLDDAGNLSKEIMPDALHLSPAGYKIWAEAIEAKLKVLLDEN